MNELSDWNLLRAFVAVAESGSSEGAARRLGVSTRTLARRLDQLERELGVALVTRSGRPVALSGTGARLHQGLRGPMCEVADLLAEARRSRTVSLRIAISSDLPVRWTGKVHAWLGRDAHPAIVETRAAPVLARLLADGDIDLGVQVGDFGPPSVVVGYEPAVILVPATHPSARHAAIPMGSLGDLPVAVSPAATREQRRAIVDALHGEPGEPAIITPYLGTTSPGLLRAVRDHGAAAVALADCIADLDTTGVAVRPLDPAQEVAVSIAAAPGLAQGASRALADALIGLPA